MATLATARVFPSVCMRQSPESGEVIAMRITMRWMPCLSGRSASTRRCGKVQTPQFPVIVLTGSDAQDAELPMKEPVQMTMCVRRPGVA